jgi:type II secretory pathway pseudopilin PulG
MLSKTQKRSYQNRATGFTLVELLLVVAVGMILTAAAIPVTRSAIATYKLDAAADSASGAIQATRFQAIMHGYPYEVDFDSTANTIQISNEVPPATTYSAVGGTVPISTSAVTVGVGTPNSNSAGHLILQLKPNGSIAVASGQGTPAVLTISYNGTTKNLTVSNYGSISIATTTP